jgi:hypothetical protein
MAKGGCRPAYKTDKPVNNEKFGAEIEHEGFKREKCFGDGGDFGHWASDRSWLCC